MKESWHLSERINEKDREPRNLGCSLYRELTGKPKLEIIW